MKMTADINDTNKNPKLRTYRIFKTDLRLEPYLNINLPKALYQSIARFRLSSHNLYIELGRHKRPFVPANQRICRRCDLNVIENEFHCLMICKKWTTIRSELFKTVVREIEHFLVFHPNEQFKVLLSNKTSKVNYALSKYLTIVLKTDNVV